ncbi:hypothetical protein NST84_03270 [Paenibacillus sp. FSL R7-0345]|uniref:hypothetical protein n=1 Tax=Paenibacillus sp. FSL R7-0345 TaxID=2954535 RepID=UPI00315B24A6
MEKLTLSIFERYNLLSLAKKQKLGKGDSSDLKQWDYLLSKASFTPKGYYISERVKHEYINYVKQYHPYVYDYEKYFMNDDVIKFSVKNDNKLRKILMTYQGRTL